MLWLSYSYQSISASSFVLINRNTKDELLWSDMWNIGQDALGVKMGGKGNVGKKRKERIKVTEEDK